MLSSFTVRRVNLMLLMLCALIVAGAVAVLGYETLFAIPPCPGGLSDCSMRQAHFRGAGLIGGMIAVACGYVAVWGLATHRTRADAWVSIFWPAPALAIGFMVMLIG